MGIRPALLLLVPLLAARADGRQWSPLELRDAQAEGGVRLVALDDGSLRAEGKGEPTRYRLEFHTDLPEISALRIEALPDAVLPKGGPGLAENGNFVLSEVRLRTTFGPSVRPVELVSASASYAQVGWPALAAVDGRDDTGWAIDGNQAKASQIVVNLGSPLGRGSRTLLLELDFGFGQGHALGRLRVSAAQGAGEILAEGVDQAELALRQGVEHAIERGVRWLLAQQELDGSWFEDQPTYPVGATVLALYTLVKSGVDREHQAIQRGLAFVDAHPPVKTYEAGCALMLFAALEDKARAAPVLADLLSWQMGDWGYPGTHEDRKSEERDLSCTQYGALGLRAAAQLGLAVPKGAWQKLAERTLTYQTSGDPAGFTYKSGDSVDASKVTGSMTSAGVTVLALCEPNVDGPLAGEVRKALQRGMSWLDRNFDPARNQGHPSGSWLEYYLYGIERIGAFTGTKSLNRQDWYLEGARTLVRSQLAEGRWDRDAKVQSTTSFALLFLRRASAPSSGPGAAGRAATYGLDDPGAAVNLRAAGDTPLSLWISSFGDEALRRWTFAGEEGSGPRVRSVEYLAGDEALVPDGREGGSEWRYAFKDPGPGWVGPDFDDRRWKKGASGFGARDASLVVVGTEWTEPELWLRKDVSLEPGKLVRPRIEVSFSAPVRGPAAARAELLKLYDEEATFAELLSQGPGSVRQVAGPAETGGAFLAVDGQQRFHEAIPGWGFPLREKPGEGEFRYLRFAWRKRAGGIMVQVAIDGGWGRALRYYAGENTAKFEPARSVGKGAPKDWEVVVCDLWQDLGSDGFMTGLALTPMEGAADFDALYLSRSRSALGRADRLTQEPPGWGAQPRTVPPLEDGALELWVNGELLASLETETDGFETWIESDELLPLLRPGKNALAVHARNGPGGRALDLSLRDARVLARIPGDPSRASDGERYPARVRFPRPGSYTVQARVHVVDEATGDAAALDSTPLQITVQEALAPELLRYASDSTRNLLLDGLLSASASTERPGEGAKEALDGRQATQWLCAPGDATPTLRVELTRPAKVDTLLLSPVAPGRLVAGCAPARVEVVLNGKGDPIVAELPADRLRKAEIDLGSGARVRTFEVRIVGRAGSDRALHPVGFAEVELVLQGRR